jgi:carboxymethylenebutenolidase
MSTTGTVSSTVEVRPSPEGVPGAVTDPSRIAGENLVFPGAGGERIGGYLARPSITGARRPAIIVVHHAVGLGDHVRDVANRLANLGYVALAPDLYTREGGPPTPGDMQALMARLFAMPDERVLGDLAGAAELLRAREDVTGRLGCIGFCMGGRYTLLFACSSDRLDAAVDCWGGFIDAATPDQRSTAERPTPPLELVPQLRCPLLAAIGAEDHNPSPEVGKRLQEALEQTVPETRVDFYEGAGHAFFADDRDTYRPEPAALLWQRVVPFFARHLQLAPDQGASGAPARG